MSGVLLATSSLAFEQRTRRALGSANGELTRYDSEVMYLDALAAAKDMAGRSPSVILIGPNVAVDAALGLAQALDEEHPEIEVVLIADPTPDLWQSALRSGVRDVLTPEATDDEIRVVVDRITEAAQRRLHNLGADSVDKAKKAKVICVVAPKGGTGKTAFTTNLAVSLGAHAEGKVALIDLDLQFGDVQSGLGLEPEHTIGDLAKVQGGITATALKVFMTPRGEKLHVLCAPDTPAEGEEVRDTTVERVLRLLSDDFSHIVVDTSAGLTEATLAAMEYATDFVFMCDLSVSSLESLRKVVDAIDMLGFDQPTRHFVVNRSDAKIGITPTEASELVGLPVDIEIPYSRAVALSMNHGQPVVEAAPKSPAAKSYVRAAQLFLPETERPSRRSLFFRR